MIKYFLLCSCRGYLVQFLTSWFNWASGIQFYSGDYLKIYPIIYFYRSKSSSSEAFTNAVVYGVVSEVWKVQTLYVLALSDLFLCKPSPPEAPGSFFPSPGGRGTNIILLFDPWLLSSLSMRATGSPSRAWFASFSGWCSPVFTDTLGIAWSWEWWSIKELSLPRLLPCSSGLRLMCRKNPKIWWCHLCVCLSSSLFSLSSTFL